MDFNINGETQKLPTLVVLGAGASRGASFVDAACKVRPPLDGDFFSELQRLELSVLQQPAVLGLLDFVRSEFGSDLNLSMEEFFSQVESTIRFYEELGISEQENIQRYQKALDRFYNSLPLLFQQDIGEMGCEYHERLVRHLDVGTGDAILSFNYDCIVDATLSGHADGYWLPEKGYGFPIRRGKEDYHAPIDDCNASGSALFRWKKNRDVTLTLLKMHGSLNWEIKFGSLRI